MALYIYCQDRFIRVSRLKKFKIREKGFMMKRFYSKIGLGLGLGLGSAMAAPITVDLTDATTSVNNAGTAMIGVVALIFGIGLIIYLLKR